MKGMYIRGDELEIIEASLKEGIRRINDMPCGTRAPYPDFMFKQKQIKPLSDLLSRIKSRRNRK